MGLSHVVLNATQDRSTPRRFLSLVRPCLYKTKILLAYVHILKEKVQLSAYGFVVLCIQIGQVPFLCNQTTPYIQPLHNMLDSIYFESIEMTGIVHFKTDAKGIIS